jgi:hypothetical protein
LLYIIQKMGTEQLVYTLEQLLRALRNIILAKGTFDESNPSIVMCSADLEEVLDRRALHVAKIRPIVMTHLIRTRLQTGQTIQVPRPLPLESSQPSQPRSSKTTSIATKVSISESTMFRLKPLFHKVLKTVRGASQSQTVYKYSKITKLLSEYILANRNKLIYPRHFKRAIVSGDPLGTARPWVSKRFTEAK